MDSLRRVLVCLLALVVLGETSGVARAFGPGAIVHCCCGAHSTARPCPCPDCPVTLRRERPRDAGPSQLAAAHGCDGADASDPGVLHVVAVAPDLPAAVAAPSPTSTLRWPSPALLQTRSLDTNRPPH